MTAEAFRYELKISTREVKNEQNRASQKIEVRVGTKLMGDIRRSGSGYVFVPKKGKPSEIFPSVAAAKRHIEGKDA